MKRAFLIALISLASSGCDSTPPTAQPSAAAGSAAVKAPVPLPDPACENVGQICTVKPAGGNQWTLAATSLRAYGEFQKTIRANDRDGLAQMALAQDVIGLHPGDTVRVLDMTRSGDRVEARVASGEYRGRRVWLPTAWLTGAK